MDNSWTDERIEKLRQWWSEGKTAGEIAAKFPGLSRGAVIGKVHRLGLPGRPSPILRAGSGERPGVNSLDRSMKRKKAVPAQSRAPEEPEERRVIFKPRSAPSDPCCYPIGEVRRPGFRFCDAPVLTPGRIYCDKHHTLCRPTMPAATADAKRVAS